MVIKTEIDSMPEKLKAVNETTVDLVMFVWMIF